MIIFIQNIFVSLNCDNTFLLINYSSCAWLPYFNNEIWADSDVYWSICLLSIFIKKVFKNLGKAETKFLNVMDVSAWYKKFLKMWKFFLLELIIYASWSITWPKSLKFYWFHVIITLYNIINYYIILYYIILYELHIILYISLAVRKKCLNFVISGEIRWHLPRKN